MDVGKMKDRINSKSEMPYDDYVIGETELNCINQNLPRGYGFYFWAYAERVLHELNLLKKDRIDIKMDIKQEERVK